MCLLGREGVVGLDRSVQSAVLEVFRKQLLEPEAFGVGPHMRVEPRELVRSRSTERDSDKLRVREEHVELA